MIEKTDRLKEIEERIKKLADGLPEEEQAVLYRYLNATGMTLTKATAILWRAFGVGAVALVLASCSMIKKEPESVRVDIRCLTYPSKDRQVMVSDCADMETWKKYQPTRNP